MSNYTKTTNFATKDSLPSGDANKIVKGAEINTEFDNIATAVATKSNTASPTFTGTVTIPTADINGGAIDGTTIGGSSASAVTATTLVANTSLNIASDGATVTGIKDEDDMASNSATKLATQQSIKAYVDSQVTAQDLDVTTDSGTIAIDLDSETLTVTGGTGLSSSATGNAVTLNIDSTVATLTGSQTLTNKTLTAPTISGNLTTDGTIDGRDVATDGSKLDGIEANATADQTAAEIRTLVGSATDSNVFTDADHSKLDGIEASATADQTASEIRALVESASDSNVFTDADHSKLDGIEASADVTDTANVTAAGALMDSELTSEASVKALNQGVATTDSPTFGGLTATGQGVFKVDSTDQIKIGDASLTNFWTLRAGTNLLFKDNGTERMRIDSSGNVGIGATSVDTKLHLEESGATSLFLKTQNSAGALLVGNNSAGNSFVSAQTSGKPLILETENTERMRIDSSGQVGIGTSSPSTRLTVGAGSASEEIRVNAGAGWADLKLKSNATNGGSVYFNDGADAGQIFYYHPEDNMRFHTNASERMRLDSSGRLLLGKTAYNADDVGVALHPTGTSWFSATSDYALGVNRNGTDGILINFLNDATACGNISCSGTSVSLSSASDQRLKENIEDADDAGNKIDAIQVRQFNWKSDGSHQDYGMIAQELQTVAPDAVYTPEDEEEMMGVDYSKLVPMLIKEIQSLRNRVAQLENN